MLINLIRMRLGVVVMLLLFLVETDQLRSSAMSSLGKMPSQTVSR